MGSQRASSGSVGRKGDRWFAVITMRDGGRYWHRIQPVPGVVITRPKAKAAAAHWQGEYDAGRWDPKPIDGAPTAAGPLTLGMHVAEWLKAQTYSSVAKDRLAVDRYLMKHAIAHVPMTSLSEDAARLFLEWLKSHPSERGGTLASRTIRNVWSPIARAVQGWARRAQRLNPFASLAEDGALPGIEDKVDTDRDGWEFSHAEITTLTTCTKVPLARRMRYALAFGLGARPGEWSVLRWSDWQRDVIPLSKIMVTRARGSVKRTEGLTKTKARKHCPVHPQLETTLSAWWETGWQATYGRAPALEDFIVPSQRLSAINEHVANRQFRADCVTAGLRSRNQYTARHTFVSRTQDDGADGGIVRWVTHPSPKSQFDRYSRVPWLRLCEEISRYRLDLGMPRRTPVRIVSVGASVDTPSESSAETAEAQRNRTSRPQRRLRAHRF